MDNESSILRGAMRESMELFQFSGLSAALQLLDKVIAEAVKENWNHSIIALCNHAAILCTFDDNLPLRRHYYELSLQHTLGNYRALYGLAGIFLEEGQAELARQYAKQSYDAILATDDPIAHLWIEQIKQHWPSIVQQERS
jgi:hypothetical protein